MPPLPDLSTLSTLSGPALRLLLDLALEGTVLLAAGILAVRFLPKAAASTRHSLLGVTFACLLALPILEPLVPRWEMPTPSAVSKLAARFAEPTVPPAAARVGADATTPSLGRSLPGEARGAPGSTRRARLWLVSGWAAGCVAVLLYFGLGNLRLRRVSSRSPRLTHADWLEAASWARRRLRLDRPVRLLRSSEVEVPMTFGALRPAVVLPDDVKRWHAGLRRDVLLHELAHVKRQDCLVLSAVRVACALYWFHPLAWLAAAELKQLREQACDDEVLHAGSPASEYATHLLEIARSLGRGVRAERASVAFARGRRFVGRVSALLDGDRRHGSPSRRVSLGIFAVASGLVVPLASVRPGAAPPPTGECAGEPGQSRPVVRASFATGDIVQTYLEDATHLRLPESLGRERLLVTAGQGWCAIRFAGSTGGERGWGAARLPLSFDPRSRLSLVEIRKRPPDRLPAPAMEAAGQRAASDGTKRETTT